MQQHQRPSSIALVLGWIASLTACGAGPENTLSEGDPGVAEESITNGVPSFVENVVKLFVDGQPRCSGTLIAPRWMLTAAHCFDAGDATGTIETLSGVTTTFPAANVVFEPSGLDVALVPLTGYIVLPAATYELATGELTSFFGQTGRMIGYGRDTHFDTQLRADVEIGAPSSCCGKIGLLPGTANNVSQGGDSGGPVFLDDNGVPLLIGVLTLTAVGGARSDAIFSGEFRDWAVGLIGAYEGAPADVDLGAAQTAAFATQSMRVNDRAQVLWDTLVPAAGACSGRAPTFFACASVAAGASSRIGVSAQVAGVFGAPQLAVANEGDVRGDVVTSTTPSIQQGGVIHGDVYQTSMAWPHPVHTAPLTLSIDPAYDPGNGWRTFTTNSPANILTPGNQGNVIVQSGASVTLSGPGTYFFRDLTIEPLARFNVPNTNEITRIYVLGNLLLKGIIDGGTSSNTLVGVPFATYVGIDGFVRATFVAPQAKVDVKQSQSSNFFARHVELHQGLSIWASEHPVHPNYWTAPDGDPP